MEPRDRLTKSEALLMALAQVRSNESHEALAAEFGTSPEAASKYVGFIKGVLGKISPTPANVLRRIESGGELGELVPGGAVLLAPDGARTRRAGAPDAVTCVAANSDGVIIGIGKTAEEGAGPGLPEVLWKIPGPTVFVAGGRCAGLPPGARVVDLEGGSPEAAGALSAIRGAVGRLREFGVVNGPHAGSLEEINSDVNIAAGNANMVMLGPAGSDRIMAGLRDY